VRRLLVVLLLTCFAVFALSSVAFAASPPGIVEDGVVNSGYLPPASGSNPHGGYTDSTDKCKVCHAVHGAKPPGEKLLRGLSSAGACTFCHITGGFTIDRPYGTDETNYTEDYENNHTDRHMGSRGCVGCHSVHGADTEDTTAFAPGKILRDNPGGAIAAGSVTSLNAFCTDCHDMRDRKKQGCGSSTCHSVGRSESHVYINTAANGTSHVMKAQDGIHAFGDSTDCRSCHRGGGTNEARANGNSFPHITSGAQFLVDTHTQTTKLDEVCLDCHLNGTVGSATAGVGKSF
jgi:predicted CXXCH cytochrome family protein